jgi:2,4-dienoyl-CoA reductase-like NADH-dependent reductase (Old Yellow Enzyme family)
MSAMTRSFANNNHECTSLMAEYYERRAKNGIALIISEGVIIHPTGDGYKNTPHMFQAGKRPQKRFMFLTLKYFVNFGIVGEYLTKILQVEFNR